MTRLFVIPIALATCVSGLLGTVAAQSAPIVTHDLYHDISEAVRDYRSSQATGVFHLKSVLGHCNGRYPARSPQARMLPNRFFPHRRFQPSSGLTSMAFLTLPMAA
jgi:hypothetical protein